MLTTVSLIDIQILSLLADSCLFHNGQNQQSQDLKCPFHLLDVHGNLTSKD